VRPSCGTFQALNDDNHLASISNYVKVANHAPISPSAVPRFLTRFEYVYGQLGKTDAILETAPGHHRLLWIHPFWDGNGRIGRLMSHAVLFETLDTGAVVGRSLAVSPEKSRSTKDISRRAPNANLGGTIGTRFR
jgi:Fic family protein